MIVVFAIIMLVLIMAVMGYCFYALNELHKIRMQIFKELHSSCYPSASVQFVNQHNADKE